jgi:hypothetical protein
MPEKTGCLFEDKRNSPSGKNGSVTKVFASWKRVMTIQPDAQTAEPLLLQARVLNFEI